MMRPASRLVAAACALVALLSGLAVAQATVKPVHAASGGRAHHATAGATTQAPPSRPVQTTVVTTTQAAKPPTTPQPKPAKKRRKPAQVPQLTGLLGGGTLFPERALILSPPSPQALLPSAVHVSENGVPVGPLSLTQLSNPRRNDFGVVLVIDQSMTMSGAPLTQAMQAARAMAAQRSGNQQLGLVTFDQTPSVMLPLTTNSRTINQALTSSPWVAPGARVQPALSLAFKMLHNAKVVAGAVILIADGGDVGAAPDGITDAGQSSGLQLYTVGLKDQSYGPPARVALKSLDTPFAQAAGTGVTNVLNAVWSKLTHEYIVRYRSHAPGGGHVSVLATVDGAPGRVSIGYLSPTPPPPPRPHPRPAPRPVKKVLPVPAPPKSHPATSFWNSTLAIVLISLVATVLVGLALVMVFSQYSARGRIQKRVATFIPDEAQDALVAPDAPVASDQPSGWMVRQRWWPSFVEQVEIAGLKRSPAQLVKRALFGSLLLACVVDVVSGSMLLALLGLAVGPIVLKFYVKRAVEKRRRQFVEQLPTHLQDLAGAMRSGRSIIGAITAVAQSADQPLRTEFERVVADEGLGKPLEEALQEVGARMKAEDMEQFALITSLHRRSGSNVAEALDRVAEGARERADMIREMRALTSQAKISSRVLTALPPLMLVAIELLDPAYAKPLFGTVIGIVVLVIAAIMVVMGWMVMNRIVNVEA